MFSIRRSVTRLLAFFTEEDRPSEPRYDPVHVAAMIILVLFSLTALFWLLWSLLVFGGGIQAKIVPFAQVLFTAKTAADFGYQGYPYEMGIFEGWPTNVISLAILLLILSAGWYALACSRAPQTPAQNAPGSPRQGTIPD